MDYTHNFLSAKKSKLGTKRTGRSWYSEIELAVQKFNSQLNIMYTASHIIANAYT